MGRMIRGVGGVAAVLLAGVLLGGAALAAGAQVPEVPKNDRLWAGIPWLIAAGMTALTAAVAAKNARRTHLD